MDKRNDHDYDLKQLMVTKNATKYMSSIKYIPIIESKKNNKKNSYSKKSIFWLMDSVTFVKTLQSPMLALQ